MFNPQADVWTLEDFEGKLNWVVETWHDPGQIKIVETEDGHALECAGAFGKDHKTAISRKIDLDLSSRQSLTVRMSNLADTDVKVALCVLTNPGWQFFESAQQPVAAHQSATLCYSLRAAVYKSEKTQWKHTTAIENPENGYQLVLMIYSEKPATFRIDDVRLLK